MKQIKVNEDGGISVYLYTWRKGLEFDAVLLIDVVDEEHYKKYETRCKVIICRMY
ncbi:hypothetical protein ACT7CY_02915 [Bacillus pacificus]